jgi:tetrahydromethanopterin S-methyltransferase subunit A
MVYTANLGITRIIMNVTTNPSIRFLLICGRDSELFKPGQSLVALSEKGTDGQNRIIDSTGYEPVLQSIKNDQVTRFRQQVEVLDWTGEEDFDKLQTQIKTLAARNPGVFTTTGNQPTSLGQEQFVSIRPGGQREPLIYDPKGYFVISLDRDQNEIILRHYLTDHTPAHEMRGRGATSMVLGLIRDGLVTQLSHAAYLGEELAKAQTALQFDLRYDQDRLLRSREATVAASSEIDPKLANPTVSPPTAEPATLPKMPAISVPMSWKEFQETSIGDKVNFVIAATVLESPNMIEGVFAEPDIAQPFNVFHRTSEKVRVKWDPATTKTIMGTPSEVTSTAILRIGGKRGEERLVQAEGIVILTNYAKVD